MGDMDPTFDVQLLPGNRAVLAVRGPLNAVTALPFRARVKELVHHGSRQVVCDLTEVVFLDSSGLAALIAAVRATREHGGFFRMVVQTERVARVFKLTGLERVFELYPRVEAALGQAMDGEEISRVA
jgi:anti-sigma B factor antagonist